MAALRRPLGRAYLAANSYPVQIVNLGRRLIADSAYDPVAHLRWAARPCLRDQSPPAAPAQGALAVARLLKELHPDR